MIFFKFDGKPLSIHATPTATNPHLAHHVCHFFADPLPWQTKKISKTALKAKLPASGLKHILLRCALSSTRNYASSGEPSIAITTISAPHGSTNFTDARAVTPGFLIYRIICRRCNPHSHDVVVHHFQSQPTFCK